MSHKGVGRPFLYLLIEKQVQEDARLAAKLLNKMASRRRISKQLAVNGSAHDQATLTSSLKQRRFNLPRGWPPDQSPHTTFVSSAVLNRDSSSGRAFHC